MTRGGARERELKRGDAKKADYSFRKLDCMEYMHSTYPSVLIINSTSPCQRTVLHIQYVQIVYVLYIPFRSPCNDTHI